MSETFKGRYEMINGKKTLVITPIVKEIIKEDGTKDVIIQVPSLSLINKAKDFKEE